MPTRAEAVARNQALMETAEARAARQVAAAYNQARRELMQALIGGWTGTGVLTPEEAQRLLHQSGLLRQIDERLLALEREFGGILRDVIIAGEERALEAVRREMASLPAELRQDLTPFTRINVQMVERFLPIALEDAKLGTDVLRSQLRRELQAGLLQGESFDTLVRRLMASSEPSVFRRGAVSAELATRRMVIHAENAARLDFIGQAKAGIPALRKQVVAVIAGNTTETCLAAHGQIADVDEPFDLGSYEPQFASKMMHTPFHWNCRSAVAAWHPQFESGAMTTASMRSSARAEVNRRAEE